MSRSFVVVSDIADYLLFAERLLICSKYSHQNSLNAIHIIDYQNKSKIYDFLDESKRYLRIIINEIFGRNAEINIIRKSKDIHLSKSFIPIKVSKENACPRTLKSFKIRINQFRHKDLLSVFTQYRQEISGKRVTDHADVDHLNLIDYSYKAYDFFPYVIIKNFEKFIYLHVFAYIEKDIKNCHPKLLFNNLPRYITVLKLLNLESRSTLSYNSYFRIVDNVLFEKKHEKPLQRDDIWRLFSKSERLLMCAIERMCVQNPAHNDERLQWALRVSHQYRYDLYSAWMRGNKLRSCSNCPVSTAVMTGRYSQLKMLLLFGFQPNCIPIARYNVLIRHLIRTELGLCRPLNHIAFGQKPVIQEVLMFLLAKYYRSEDTDLTEQMDKCFYHLWTVLPYPFVIKQQLLDEVDILFLPFRNNRSAVYLKKQYQNAVDLYSDMAFDRFTESEPRRLTQLCRCCIREVLLHAGNLPYGAMQLPIAKHLQEFVLARYPDFR